MRLGVFGGSFNPPHHCHVLAVGLALSSGEVDRVVVIPTHVHPFDKPLAPFSDRMEMCRRAFAVFGDRVEVSDLEARVSGPSYTVDTLRALREERPHPALRLILGTDLLAEVDRWRDFDDVVTLAPPLWIGREGPGAGEVIFPFRLPDISSTEIRRRLASGDAPQGLIPGDVLDYIRSAGLYGPGSTAPLRSVLFLGMGKVGSVLSRWFEASGAAVRGWDPRDGVPLHVPAAAVPDLVVVAAPDGALGSVAGIMEDGGIPETVPAVHCSGAAPVRVLASGARPVGRMHPLFPFAAADLPLGDLAGLHLVLEGDAPAVAAAGAAVLAAGGTPIPVQGLDPRRYHAACVMAANHLVALGMVAEEEAVAAGVPAAKVPAAMAGLMVAALRNARRLGFRGSLTGPAARGDRATVLGHLEALDFAPAEVKALYAAANTVLDKWTSRGQN
jgi:nicotinate-nucleotide adenylyltransferase